MGQELIKQVVKIGNSSGVLLPKKWLNGKAKVELVEEPLDIKKDVLSILESCLEHVLGIYLTGSYARKEQTEESDVDVLVITSEINKKIHEGKYNIILVSKGKLEKQLRENALPLISMIREAKPIINSELINNYKKTKLNKRNLKWQIETTKSALKVINKSIEISKEIQKKYIENSSVYSLVLRLRTMYIIDCFKKNRSYTNKDFKYLIKKIAGDLKAYKIYEKVKKGEETNLKLLVEKAERLENQLQKEIEKIEKWLKEKRE